MSKQLAIELMADLANLEKADRAIAEFGGSMAWPEKTLSHVRLVVEELMMNIITHGSDRENVPRIRIRLAQQDETLVMEVADDGVAFDPLLTPPPDLDSSLDERRIGGLGVHLIRGLMDSVSYRREGGWNRLSATKTMN